MRYVLPLTILLSALLVGLVVVLGFYMESRLSKPQDGFAPHQTPLPEHLPAPDPEDAASGALAHADGSETATFGMGCFWCTEAVFQRLKGVQKVVSGYSGGSVPNPTYRQVCSGQTGHAEVIQLTFDPRVLSYPELLAVFWQTHDPTTPNRQGFDRGPQYRSVIFHHSDRQRRLAEQYRRKIDAAQVFPAPLVTEIVPFTAFYPAEDYHQNYYSTNPDQPYCKMIIGPKLEKLKKLFESQ